MKLIILLVLISLIILPVNIFASDTNDIFKTSVDEIKNPDVVSAAKLKQPIDEAPAIIDIITDRQISDFNIDNLYELISFLPGIEMMETYFGRTVLQFRGLLNIHYNNKILLMINGSAIYEPVNGTFFLESIPTNSIKRIEIIRGPGSSLYGTNAYAGVINVITYKGNDPVNSLILKNSLGSFSTLNSNLSTNLNLDVNSGFFIAGGINRSDGFKFNVISDENGNSENFNYKNNIYKAIANYSDLNYSIDILYSVQEKRLYGLVPIVDYKGIQKHHNLFINVRYSKYFNRKNQFSIVSSLNYYDNPETNIGYFPYPGFDGHDPNSTVSLTASGQIMNFESQFKHNYSKNISTIVGLNFETLMSDKYQFLWNDDNTEHPNTAYSDEKQSNTVSGYTQLQIKLFNKFSTTSGIRLVKNSDIGKVFFTPRTGLIYKYSNKLLFKLLYGKAFRFPTFFEKYVETYNVLYGSTSLKQEEIQTVDFAIINKFKQFNSRLNFFAEYTKNGIIREPVLNTAVYGANAVQYANNSKLDIYGFEYAFSFTNKKYGYMSFNVSWKKGKDKLTDNDLLYFSNLTGNFWASIYKFSPLYITPTIQYVGARKGQSSLNGEYTLDDYYLVNISSKYNYNNFSFVLTLKNILDTEYSYPEYVRKNINEIPGGPGREIKFSVKYNKL
ncbi:MAG: TonB-dependent receptor [candidate division Zixibacteria bacterium]|nr:TonB-dependent receptor [candidate division Zixibacteria bacterium]